MFPTLRVPDTGVKSRETQKDGGGSVTGDENASVTVMEFGSPFKLSKCPIVYDETGYPEGFHTQEVLTSLGYSADEIKEMM